MDGKRKGFLVALVIGLGAAPALALFASGLLGGEAAANEPATTVVAAVAAVEGAPAAATATTPAADLETACAVEGADLVAREAAGMLSELQQAALDSLRPICKAEGFSLEAAPVAGAPVTAGGAATTITTTAPAAQLDDGGDEGEYEDHDDESDEDEGEYEDQDDESGEDGSGDHEEDD